MTATGRSQSRDEPGSAKSGPMASIGRALRRTGSQLAAFVTILWRAPRPLSRRVLPWPSSVGLLAGSAVAIAVVAAAMLYLDAWAIEQVRFVPFRVLQAFDDFTDLGLSGWFLFPASALVIAIAALATPALGRIANLVLLSIVVRLQFVFFAVAVPGLLFTVLKRLVGRVRLAARICELSVRPQHHRILGRRRAGRIVSTRAPAVLALRRDHCGEPRHHHRALSERRDRGRAGGRLRGAPRSQLVCGPSPRLCYRA